MLKNILIASVLLFISSSVIANTIVGIYPVNNSEDLNLSGLTICNNEILTISDKQSNYIYSIVNKDKNFSLQEKHSILIPDTATQTYSFFNNLTYWLYNILDGNNYDWEGIACEGTETYLVSERHSKILSVSSESSNHWIEPNIEDILDKNLLSKFGAFFEGISLDKDHFYLAVEREPRGLVKINRKSHEIITINSFGKEDVINDRSADIAGLYVWKNKLYLLSRNKEEICLVNKLSLEILDCLSYKEVITKVEYESDEFGTVEGLAITDDFIYLIIDNNDMRIKGTEDKRSRLIILKNSLN